MQSGPITTMVHALLFGLLSLLPIVTCQESTSTSTTPTASASATTPAEPEPSYLRSEWAIPGSPWANLTTQIQTSFNPGSDGAVNITGLTHDGLAIFLGIPFAQPPTGDLRFERPQPAVYSDSVDATRAPNACLQRTKTGSSDGIGISEDCLQINIITPIEMIESEDEKDPLPVMVWIYGGGFYAGSATLYTSPEFVKFSKQIDRPVVLVTIAYRVGIFGFPQGAEMAARNASNLGLRDQILGLEWVRDNIASFGGDPNRVTLFGESAGAISIALLMLNETQDLFHAAIMESGAQSTLPFGVAGSVYQKPYDLLVENAGCNGTHDTVDCLKGLPGDDLLAAQLKMIDSEFAYAWGYPFGVAIDGDLIPASPFHMLKNGTFARIPFISGCNKDEGTQFLPASISTNLTEQPLSFGLNLMYPAPLEEPFLRVIEENYPRDASLGAPFGSGEDLFGGVITPAWKQATGVITDLAFQSRRRWFLRQANSHGFNQTWSYEFNATNPKDLDYMGSSHEAEKPYVMGRATLATNYTSDQVALGHSIMEYWINFAYFFNPNGDPNVPCAEGKTDWKPHTFPDDKNSLQLATANISVIQDDFREEQIAIFNQPENAYYVRRSFTP